MPNGTGLTARKVSKSRELHEPIRHILAVGIKLVGLNRFAVLSCGKLRCDRDLLHF